MYYVKTQKSTYHKKRITRADILARVSSVKNKNYYEPGGEFLILTKNMQPAMYVYGKVYAEGPQVYKAGRYVYGYENGTSKLLLCEDAKCVDGSEYQSLSMGSEAEVGDFVKDLRGDLFIMSVKDYEKYMNDKSIVFWVYGSMPLKAGSPVVITKLIMQGRHYSEFDEKAGTILYRFGNNEPKIVLTKKGIDRYTTGNLPKEIVPGPGSIIRPCGW